MAKGLALILGLSRAGIAVRRAVRGLRALGRGRLERVSWEGGEIAPPTICFCNEGVIPDTQISLALQLAHRWDDRQLCWRPVVDRLGPHQPSRDRDRRRRRRDAGAAAAALSGRLAALDAAAALGRIDDAERDRRAGGDPRRPHPGTRHPAVSRRALPPGRKRADPGRRGHRLPLRGSLRRQIRRAVRLGATGPNQVKAFLRCGMGPCQGRVCGPIVGAVIARARGVPIAELGIIARVRPTSRSPSARSPEWQPAQTKSSPGHRVLLQCLLSAAATFLGIGMGLA